jgi:hypothetical protein
MIMCAAASDINDYTLTMTNRTKLSYIELYYDPNDLENGANGDFYNRSFGRKGDHFGHEWEGKIGAKRGGNISSPT